MRIPTKVSSRSFRQFRRIISIPEHILLQPAPYRIPTVVKSSLRLRKESRCISSKQRSPKMDQVWIFGNLVSSLFELIENGMGRK